MKHRIPRYMPLFAALDRNVGTSVVLVLMALALLISFGQIMPVEAEIDAGNGNGRLNLAAIADAIGVDATDLESATKAEPPGLYEVVDNGGNIFHVDKDLRYALLPEGGVFAITENGLKPLTANRLAMRSLAIISPERAIVFPAAGIERARIYAFTDIHCGYCQRLHAMIPALQRAGVAVHYLPAPIFERSAETMSLAWCAADPAATLTALKTAAPKGEAALAGVAAAVTMTPGCTFDREHVLQVMHRLSIQGTPTLFNESGKFIQLNLDPATFTASILATRVE